MKCRTPRRQDAKKCNDEAVFALLGVLASWRSHLDRSSSRASDLLSHRPDLLKQPVEFLSRRREFA
jgi:hypothetical protein